MQVTITENGLSADAPAEKVIELLAETLAAEVVGDNGVVHVQLLINGEPVGVTVNQSRYEQVRVGVQPRHPELLSHA